ncbi:MAG: type IV secretion system DNA-binding domain-containing protein [Candidatus Dojkabacteria bacterium]|nr:type IV secretion system DNA-binding domain-containing protein [Candidatus Dojkabacteria bacterium]
MQGIILLLLITSLVIIIVAYFIAILFKKSYLEKIVQNSINNAAIFQVLFPTDNTYTTANHSRFLKTIFNMSTVIVSFEIFCSKEVIKFLLVCRPEQSEYIINQLYSEFPDIQIKKLLHKDLYLEQIARNKNSFISFVKNKEYTKFINDSSTLGNTSIGSIIAALSNLQEGEFSYMQIICKPKQTNENLQNEIVEKNQDATSTKTDYFFFRTQIRIMVSTKTSDRSEKIIVDVAQAFKQYNSTVGNTLKVVKLLEKNSLLNSTIKIFNKILLPRTKIVPLNPIHFFLMRTIENTTSSYFSIDELVSMYYFPNQNITNPNIEWLRSRKIPFPINIPTYDPSKGKDNPRIFAMTDYRDIHKIFGIKKVDRRRHFYLIGKSGSGKSTLLKNMILGDIYFDEGVGVIDPHGDLIEEILDHIPQHRKNDVILIDPSDVEYPVGLNMVDIKEGETRELLADGIVSVFKKFFSDSWGPRLQYMLTNVILTLLYCQNVSLIAVPRILNDKNYRKFLLKQVDDSFLQKYWTEEYVKMAENSKLLNEAISPILNKVGRFLNSNMIRNMIGQVKSTIDLGEVMNKGKILLINLSQGKVGEENSSLLGGMLVTRLYSNAMQRAKIPENERKDFYLYVDEFQNFANDSFAKILSEARKYGLCLILAHQYLDQLDGNLQSAIFGNVGTILNYVVSSKDAEVFAKEYYPYLTTNDLIHLDRYHLALKMTIDGQQSKPFTAIALKPFFKKTGLSQEIKELSRKKYAKTKTEIESKLSKWLNAKYDDNGNLIQEKKNNNENVEQKSTNVLQDTISLDTISDSTTRTTKNNTNNNPDKNMVSSQFSQKINKQKVNSRSTQATKINTKLNNKK